jgi:hypothetical protein
MVVAREQLCGRVVSSTKRTRNSGRCVFCVVYEEHEMNHCVMAETMKISFDLLEAYRRFEREYCFHVGD